MYALLTMHGSHSFIEVLQELTENINQRRYRMKDRICFLELESRSFALSLRKGSEVTTGWIRDASS